MRMVKLSFGSVDFYMSEAGLASFVSGGLMANHIVPIKYAVQIIDMLLGGRSSFEVEWGAGSFKYSNGMVDFVGNNLRFVGTVESMEADGEEASPF